MKLWFVGVVMNVVGVTVGPLTDFQDCYDTVAIWEERVARTVADHTAPKGVTTDNTYGACVMLDERPLLGVRLSK